MLYIDKNATIDALRTENTRLDEQMTDCEEQRSRMESTSLESVGLKGAGYEALGERLRMRTQVLAAHYVAFSKLRKANENNITHIGRVPDCDTPGIYDDSVVDQRVAAAQASIMRLENECQDAVSELGKSILGEDRFSSGFAGITETISSTDAFYRSLIEVQKGIIADYYERRRQAEEYRRISSAIYSNVQSYSSILDQSTSSVAGCIATGVYADLSWTEGLEQQHRAARQQWIDSRIEKVAGYLNEDELASYRDALSDGFIGADDIYRGAAGISDSYFNEQLYSVLVKLPGDLVSDREIGSIATAYNLMWEAGDLQQVERLFELSYVPTGQIRQYDTLDSESSEMPQTTFVFSRCGLLDRVNTDLQRSISLEDKTERYYSHLAALNVMGVLLDGNQTIESLDASGIDIGITEFTDATGDAHSAHAAMYLLEFNPKQGGSLFEGNGFYNYDTQKTLNSLYEANFCFSGDLADIKSLMANMTSSEIYVRGSLVDDWGATGVGVILSAVGVAPVSLPVGIGLAVVGSFISVFSTTAGLGQDEENAQKSQSALAGAYQSGDARNAILDSLGFTLNMTDVSNVDLCGQQQDSFGDYSLNVVMSDTAQKNIDFLSEAFSHEPRMGGYSTNSFLDDLENDLNNTVTLNSGNDSQAFLTWCGDDADLVYKGTVPDVDGTIHTPGETVRISGLTNYDYVTVREAPGSPTANYQYRWEWNSQHPEDPR